MAKITKILAREILDSRGWPTVEAAVYTKNDKASASAPCGKSTGKNEAKELRDGGKRYLGKGVLKAVKNIKAPIAKRLIGRDVKEQEFLDEAMIHLDGTPNKKRLGANAILAVSMAAARLAANEKGIPLFKHLMQCYGFKKAKMPMPFLNIINGGAHAGNNLALQEYMINPRGKTFAEALRKGTEAYQTLKKQLEKKYGKSAVNVGDEGGFAPNINESKKPLQEIQTAIKKSGYSRDIKLAVDAAATSFYRRGKYFIDGKLRTKQWMMKFYSDIVKKYSIISVEDPFNETDFKSFAELTKKTGKKVQIVGDDLLCTNKKLIEKAIKEKSCNALLLKINQIGTITETVRAAKLAMKNKWNIMVSHRSGETNDDFISHLAVAIGCGQIKAGAPCRGERLAKYNELLRIEE